MPREVLVPNDAEARDANKEAGEDEILFAEFGLEQPRKDSTSQG